MMSLRISFLALSFLLFQSCFAKNMDMEWGGMSCWFDAMIHCLTEYTEMNDFLRQKYMTKSPKSGKWESKPLTEEQKNFWLQIDQNL